MTTIEQALYYHLTHMTPLTDLVGQHIYPAGSVRERDVDSSAILGYVTFQRISNVHEDEQLGSANLASPRWQFNCVGKADGDLSAVARAARIRTVLITEAPGGLRNYGGNMGPPGETVDVKRIVLVGDTQGPMPATTGGEWGPQQEILDFVIWHEE